MCAPNFFKKHMDIAFIQGALIYASELVLLSIGFTLTYLTAKIPNFAHGTYAGIGIYVVYTFVKVFGLSPYAGFPVAFIFGGLVSIVVYILVIDTNEDGKWKHCTHNRDTSDSDIFNSFFEYFCILDYANISSVCTGFLT